MLMQFQNFDGSYLDRLRSGDFATEQHFFAYFGELIRLKASKRLHSSVAIARPIPLEPPVTIATFPSRVPILSSPKNQLRQPLFGSFRHADAKIEFCLAPAYFVASALANITAAVEANES